MNYSDHPAKVFPHLDKIADPPMADEADYSRLLERQKSWEHPRTQEEIVIDSVFKATGLTREQFIDLSNHERISVLERTLDHLGPVMPDQRTQEERDLDRYCLDNGLTEYRGHGLVTTSLGDRLLTEHRLRDAAPVTPLVSAEYAAVRVTKTQRDEQHEMPWEILSWREPQPQIARIMRVMWGQTRAVSCDTFMEKVWGSDSTKDKTLNTAISRANDYLEAEGHRQRLTRERGHISWV